MNKIKKEEMMKKAYNFASAGISAVKSLFIV
jgi:hypothetical protein